jgi:diguanylate cyclase (GGDEF)-like protein
MWVRAVAVALLAIVAVPAQAAGPHPLQERCRVAADPAVPIEAVLAELGRCSRPASRHHNGTLWIAYDQFPVWLEPTKTWRLTLDNHKVRAVDLWLVMADGRRQHYRYDPRAADREWASGNYFSVLVTPRDEVKRLVLRLTDSQSHTFVRPPLIARAKDFAPAERNQAALYGMGVGMLALTILFHLSLFFAIRRRFQLIYCAHVGLLLAYALCYSGIIRLVAPGLSSTNVSDMLSFTMAAATGTGIGFIVEFLGSALRPWLRRWALIASGASLLAAVLIVAVPTSLSFGAYVAANVVATHAVLLTIGILSLACWRRHPMAGLVTIGWVMPITVSLMYPARTLGLIAPDMLPDGLMMIASTIECLILSLPVTSRIRDLRIEHERAQERHVVLERQAQTDALTGLANRRGFGDAMTRAAAAQVEPAPVALLLIDIDHFKKVNDQHGHAAGDAILQHVAGVVARVAGAGAIVSRFGGEEFLVALRGYDLIRAGTIAERIRNSIGITFEAEAALPRVTVSIGLAAGCSEQIDAVLMDADCALYRAKNEGRNRVVVADGPLMYAAAA